MICAKDGSLLRRIHFKDIKSFTTVLVLPMLNELSMNVKSSYKVKDIKISY